MQLFTFFLLFWSLPFPYASVLLYPSRFYQLSGNPFDPRQVFRKPASISQVLLHLQLGLRGVRLYQSGISSS